MACDYATKCFYLISKIYIYTLPIDKKLELVNCTWDQAKQLFQSEKPVNAQNGKKFFHVSNALIYNFTQHHHIES